MGLGWRRAFCTSIPRGRKASPILTNEEQHPAHTTPKQKQSNSSKLSGFFSTPSTPPCRSPTPPTSTHRAAVSNPSSPSPRSPSTFSLLKSTLGLSKNRCGICLHTVKTTGETTPIFTAECSHTFHCHCIVSHLKNQSQLICPICTSIWNEIPLLSPQNPQSSSVDQRKRDISPAIDCGRKQHSRTGFKVYNDDEPLMSPTSLAHFNPIPEFDENGGEESDTGVEEFQGFFVNSSASSTIKQKARNIEVRLLPEAAVVSVGRSYETCAVVLTVKAPPALEKSARRAPIDLVAVLDASGNMTTARMQMMKRAMRLLVSSLSAVDRLSIVAFSANSKRLLPLRRMTTNGRRSARQIIDALAILESGSSNTGDALKKALKVLEDRREKNPKGSIMIFSSVDEEKSLFNQRQQLSVVSSTRHAHQDITVHRIRFDHGGACQQTPSADSFAKCARDLLSVVVENVNLNLGFLPGSAPAEIAAVYSCSSRPETLGWSSGIGDLYGDEEREFLVELRVPVSSIGSHHVMSVQCCYKDPSTQQIFYNKEVSLLIPRPHAVRSSAPTIQRLRSLFISTRALAESRRLVDRSDLNGAQYMLTSARALLLQAGSMSAQEFVGGLEAELKELEKRVRQSEKQRRSSTVRGKELLFVDEKGEPLTPTSAWRAAEKLAKVAAMRKSLNKVSDLHGFEDARF